MTDDTLLAGLGSIEHNFVGPQGADATEVYLKRSVLLPGAGLRQHVHNFDHAALLAKGSAAVRAVDGVWQLHHAPAVVLIRAGVAHEVMTAEGCVWYCVHVTDEHDETTIDQHLIKG